MSVSENALMQKYDGRHSRHHALQPEGLAHAFGDLRARPVVAVERQAEVLPELRAVGEDARSELIERLDRRAAGIAGVLSMTGGIAPISTAFATRLVPCRPM